MPKRTEVLRVPLSTGQRDDVDPKVATMFKDGAAIKRADNMLIRKDGRLGMRNGAQAVTMSTVGSTTVKPVDIYSSNDRLYALGSFTNAASDPSNLFEYTNAVPYAWHPRERSGSQVAANQVYNVREKLQIAAGLTTSDVACANGFACLVFAQTNIFGATIQVFRQLDGAKIVSAQVVVSIQGPSFAFLKAIPLGNGAFLIATGNASSNQVDLFRFNPASDTSVQTLTPLFASGGAALLGFDFAPVVGATNVGIAFLDRTAVNALIHRVDDTGATVGSDISLAGTNSVRAAIESNNTNVSVALVDSTGPTATLRTFLLSSGALLNGPTTLWTPSLAIAACPVLVRFTSTQLLAMGNIVQTASIGVQVKLITESTHATAAQDVLNGRQVTSKVGVSNTSSTPLAHFAVSGPYFGANTDPINNYLMVWAPTTTTTTRLTEAVLDPLIALPDTGSIVAYGGFLDSTTKKFYWIGFRSGVLDAASRSIIVYEAQLSTGGRRQVARLNGSTYIAGGVIQYEDEVELSENSWCDRPSIVGLTQTATGSLTLLGVYQYVCVWEWQDGRGRLVESAPSEISTVTLTGGNNSVQVQVSYPELSTRKELQGARPVLAVYRTQASGQIFRRVASTTNFGAAGLFSTVTDISSDITQQTKKPLYTTGDRGALSGVLANDPAPACSLLTAGRDIMAAAGLPDPSQFIVSKSLFPAEGLNWSAAVAFKGSVSDRITGIHFLDGNLLIWTRNALYVTSGQGPSDAGIQDGVGLANPQLLSPECGLIDASGGEQEWRSILQDRNGVWWQSDTDKLMFLARGGSVPEWNSKPVQDTLAAFPIITAAFTCQDDYLACWVCTNVISTVSVVVCRDSRTGQWFVHQYAPGIGVIVAACEYLDKPAFLNSSGAVFLVGTGFQDLVGVYIFTTLETNSFYPAGIGNTARLCSLTLLGESRSSTPGNILVDISYDDGATYTSLTTAALVTTVGAPQHIERHPERQLASSFRLMFRSQQNVSLNEWLAISELSLEYMVVPGTARLTPAEVA